jgi:hypothetical protein
MIVEGARPKRDKSTLERAREFQKLEEMLKAQGIRGKRERERRIAENTGFSERYVHRLLRHYHPIKTPRVPCPGCRRLIDRSELPSIDERLSRRYARERIIERVITPQTEIREIQKPIEWKKWVQICRDALSGLPLFLAGPVEDLTQELVSRRLLKPPSRLTRSPIFGKYVETIAEEIEKLETKKSQRKLEQPKGPQVEHVGCHEIPQKPSTIHE